MLHHPITAVLAVDTSPRWLYDHTLLQTEAGHEEREMARVSERIASLLLAAEEAGRPVIPVESQQLWRVRLSDLRRPAKRLGLCGPYGDECVLAVAHRLTRRGYRVVILEDACLWSWPPDAEDHAPALDQIPRASAVRFTPDFLAYLQDFPLA